MTNPKLYRRKTITRGKNKITDSQEKKEEPKERIMFNFVKGK